MGDEHAPKGEADGREADPGLVGQQPEAQKALHDGTANAGQETAEASGGPGSAGASLLLGKGEEEPAEQGQQCRPGGQAQGLRQEKACQQGQQRQGRDQTPAQIVEQTPAVEGAQRPPKDPGEVLPVAPGPAVKPLEIGQRPGGKTVGKGHVTAVGAMKKGTLQRVVGENTLLRQS